MMNARSPRNSIIVLFCGDALAAALGAEHIVHPARRDRLAGIEDGSVIAVMATSGENYLWPIRGAA